ncbi:MAG: hypothetical protein HXY20_08900 [Acidobacteria bacterium]|nr:hypothetical protein [Acidobacteriota bacterium]
MMDADFRRNLERLAAVSPPMRNTLAAHPDWLEWLKEQASDLGEERLLDYGQEWSSFRGAVESNSPGFLERLRAFKRREYLRIALADTAGYWSFTTTVRNLSRLGDAVIGAALCHCWSLPDRDPSKPAGIAAGPGGFTVFALGKLGGNELNYSSDVDLLFFRRSSDTPEESRFFTRLGERLIDALSHPGADGFLYRVDMRLRPQGESGPLVPTIDSLVTYYESWAEAWERQALIKARFVGGDRLLGQRFGDFLARYTFARQLDDWSLEELKRVKHRAEREHQAGPGRIHIKQGPGGIRDIEFYTQYHQLVAGSSHPEARAGSTLEALEGLAEARALLDGEVTALSLAYQMLRTVEHRLQLRSLTPQSSVPVSRDELELLARGLGFVREGSEAAPAFEAVLAGHRGRVRKILERIYLTPGYQRLTEREEEFAQLLSERTPKARVREILAAYNFEDTDKAWQNLRLLAQGPEGRHLPPNERRVFLEFVFPLLEVLRDSIDPDLALHHLEGFAAASGNRISFLRSLASRKPHLARLTNLLAYSKRCHQILVRHPEFFDSLARGIHLHEGRTAAEMAGELRERFGAAPKREPRALTLRRYRQREMVRIAYRDMAALAGPLEISAELSDLAEACVLATLEISRVLPEDVFEQAPDVLTCVAAGKLGSRQMHYASDLDLVFFYRAPEHVEQSANERARLQQSLDDRVEAIVELLKGVTSEGLAYHVDLRLRQEGQSGLLARTWESFLDYAQAHMQPWERMAMVRSRALGASPQDQARWARIVRQIVYEYGWDDESLESVRHLKRRAETELNRESRTHIDFKYGRGGVTDLEYLVQFLQLRHGRRSEAVRSPRITQALPALSDAGAITGEECAILLDAHRFQRHVENHYQLQEEWPLREVSRESPALGRLARSLGYQGDSPAGIRRRFISDWEERAREVRRLFEKYFLA